MVFLAWQFLELKHFRATLILGHQGSSHPTLESRGSTARMAAETFLPVNFNIILQMRTQTRLSLY